LEPRDNTKNSNKDKCSPRQSPGYSGPSSFYRSKKNISKNANAFRDRSADNTTGNNVKIEEEAPVATSSV